MRHCSLALVLTASCLTGQAPDTDWQQFQGENAKLPAARDLPALVDRLVALLGHPDPKQRDDIGYALLAKWILRDGIVGPNVLRPLLGKLTAGLDAKGEHGVLRRSFSMLCLSLLAKRDLDAPWMTKAEFERLLVRSIRFLHEERDPRGYDDQLGWVHCAAHTADTLKFLARSKHLTAAGQTAIVDAVCSRIESTRITWTAGEDMRLARTLLAVCAREDFDAKALRQRLGKLMGHRVQGAARQLTVGQNRIHLMVSLFALLELDRRKLDSIGAARKVIRQALGG